MVVVVVVVLRHIKFYANCGFNLSPFLNIAHILSFLKYLYLNILFVVYVQFIYSVTIDFNIY